MIRKIISQLSALIVLIVFFTSCSSTPEYSYIIPADASVVGMIDLQALFKKAGLDKKENDAAKQKILDALKGEMNAATYQQVERIFANPIQSGIDIESPVYSFRTASLPNLVTLAHISDEEDLNASINVLVKEELAQPVEEEENYKFTTLNESLIIFNKEAVMIVTAKGKKNREEIRTNISKLLQQTEEESFVKSKGFQQMMKQAGEFKCFFASVSQLEIDDIFPIKPLMSVLKPTPDLGLITSTTFENGKISVEIEPYTENEETLKTLKKQSEIFKETENTFVKYFPSSTLAFFNASINGKELYNLLKNSSEFRKEVSIAEADQLQNLFGALNGDVSIGILNVSLLAKPSFIAYAEMNQSKALEAIYQNKESIGLKLGEDIIELSKDEYLYKCKEQNIFYGIKNDQMYLTNNELIYKNIGNEENNSIKQTAYNETMNEKSVFMVVNAEEIMNLPVIKMLCKLDKKHISPYIDLATDISYICYFTEKEKSIIEICMKDKDTNALKQIVDAFKGMTLL